MDQAPVGAGRPQHRALGHAEAVLLVDDRQRQVGEADGVLQQGVRPHDDEGPRRGHLLQDGPARRFRRGSGQQADPHGAAQGPQQGGDRGEVLFGEDLRGRDERPLAPVVDHARQRRQCDDGLAGADVALQEALHRRGARQVGVDGVDRRALGVGEGEGQRVLEAVAQAAGRGGAGGRLARAVPAALPHEGALEDERLPPGERAPRQAVVLVG